MLDSDSDSAYLGFIRNPTRPAALSWRPLVLCVFECDFNSLAMR